MPYLVFTVDGPPVSHQTKDKANLSAWKGIIRPKFQRARMGISIVENDLRQTLVPVSGYILINRSASACSASASVTWRNGIRLGSADTRQVFRQRVPK